MATPTIDQLRRALRHQQTERAEATERMAEYREGSIGWTDARDDRDDAQRAIDRLRLRIAAAEASAR